LFGDIYDHALGLYQIDVASTTRDCIRVLIDGLGPVLDPRAERLLDELCDVANSTDGAPDKVDGICLLCAKILASEGIFGSLQSMIIERLLLVPEIGELDMNQALLAIETGFGGLFGFVRCALIGLARLERLRRAAALGDARARARYNELVAGDPEPATPAGALSQGGVSLSVEAPDARELAQPGAGRDRPNDAVDPRGSQPERGQTAVPGEAREIPGGARFGGEQASGEVRQRSRREALMDRADAGNAAAQLELGTLLAIEGADQDLVDATRYLMLAAEQGEVQAQYRIGSLLSCSAVADVTKGMCYMKMAADREYPQAQFEYAMHLSATGQLRAAAAYLEKAAAAGVAQAQLEFGLRLTAGTGAAKNEAEAARYFKLAADQGLVEAQLKYAQVLIRGVGLSRNTDLGMRYLRLAADRGLVEAQLELAESLMTSGDARWAMHYLRLVADQGNVLVEYELARCLLDGRGTTKDESEGALYLKRAADHGHASAQVEFGLSLLAKNEELAVRYFRLAADQGDAIGRFRYGVALLEGAGMEKNPVEGLRCVRSAAEAGLAEAQLELAQRNSRERSVLPQKAADPGLSRALVTCNAAVAPSRMKKQISAGVWAAEPASPRLNFGAAWRNTTRDHHDESGDQVGPTADDTSEAALSEAIVSNDVAETGRLLLSRDVNKTWIRSNHLPSRLLRRPVVGCPVLDVAVGSSAVEVAKCLLEFHEATPTRETLKMALSCDSFELVRICWERLPGVEEKERLDLLEVPADFHQRDLLAWLFRDASPLEKELFVGFAILRHLADGLLAVLVDGFKPWWAVEAAAAWAPTQHVALVPLPGGLPQRIAFKSAPGGFWSDGGWFTNSSGVTKGICAMRGRWTPESTRSRLGKRSEVTEVVLPVGVTAIARKAFGGCTALAKISIPPGVSRIGAHAFFGRTSLFELSIVAREITIETRAFSGCSALTRLSISSDKTFLGTDAFRDCSALTKVSIRSDEVCVAVEAFCGCSALTVLSIQSRVSRLENGAFIGCAALTRLSIPSRITVIAEELFSGCSGLVELCIPAGVTSIGARAFSGCSGLERLLIPPSLTSIATEAFMCCSHLTELLIPETVRSIGPGAFSGCDSLGLVEIPGGEMSVGFGAFSFCPSLVTVRAAAVSDLSLTVSGKWCLPNRAFFACSGLSAVTLPDSVISIGDYAFSTCHALVDLVLPAMLESIGEHVFKFCVSLRVITLPNSLNKIGPAAFAESGLEGLTVPAGVRTIPSSMCLGCPELRCVTLDGQIVVIERLAFGECAKLRRVTAAAVDMMDRTAFERTGITWCVSPAGLVLAPTLFS
jgi:TPR repeat protein